MMAMRLGSEVIGQFKKYRRGSEWVKDMVILSDRPRITKE